MAVDKPHLYIALYTDADVDGRLAKQLRSTGYDALSASEADNRTLSDPEQFEFAIREQRTLLTHNARDFEPLFRKLWVEDRGHFGLIISEKLPIGELLRRVIRLLETVPADEMKNNFRNLGEFK